MSASNLSSAPTLPIAINNLGQIINHLQNTIDKLGKPDSSTSATLDSSTLTTLDSSTSTKSNLSDSSSSTTMDSSILAISNPSNPSSTSSTSNPSSSSIIALPKNVLTFSQGVTVYLMVQPNKIRIVNPLIDDDNNENIKRYSDDEYKYKEIKLPDVTINNNLNSNNPYDQIISKYKDLISQIINFAKENKHYFTIEDDVLMITEITLKDDFKIVPDFQIGSKYNNILSPPFKFALSLEDEEKYSDGEKYKKLNKELEKIKVPPLKLTSGGSATKTRRRNIRRRNKTQRR